MVMERPAVDDGVKKAKKENNMQQAGSCKHGGVRDKIEKEQMKLDEEETANESTVSSGIVTFSMVLFQLILLAIRGNVSFRVTYNSKQEDVLLLLLEKIPSDLFKGLSRLICFTRPQASSRFLGFDLIEPHGSNYCALSFVTTCLRFRYAD